MGCSVPAPVALNRWITVDAPELGFSYAIRYGKRRNAEIRVQEGKVKLYAPSNMPVQTIQRWLEDRREWVLQCLTKQQLRLAQVPQRYAEDGEVWPYLGESLVLTIRRTVKRSRPVIRRVGNQLQLTLSPNTEACELLERWYKQEALWVLTAKTTALAEQLGLAVRQVKLRRTKTKWGHCTRDGVIQYNWLIMQAPEWVVDYLVAHEVSHLKHPNHSRAFWGYVGKIYPEYRQAEHWLKQSGHTLKV